MRSTTPDLILDSAVELFSKNGFAKVSIRDIANVAGVSPGLLIHHFGSRDELITRCIESVLGELVSDKTDLLQYSLSEQVSLWQQSANENKIKLGFFKSILLAGGPHAEVLFERMVFEAEAMLNQQAAAGVVRELDSYHDIAVMMTLQSLGAVMLMDQVTKQFGGDLDSPDVSKRMAEASLEIFQKGIFTNKEKAGEK